MSDRKLVTVRTVSAIEPIENADNIELAKIDGWQCVTKKGEFSIGDVGVYFEIDSFLPVSDSRFAFLMTSASGSDQTREFEGKRGFKLKTIRLRGTLSQGLLLPLNLFPEIEQLLHAEFLEGLNDIGTLNELHDFAQMLGVVKYETPIPQSMSARASGNFPPFLPKTDEERAQNIDRVIFGKHVNDHYEVSTKLDGSSCTVYRKAEYDAVADHAVKIGVCSRNYDLKLEDSNIYCDTIRKTGLLEVLPLLTGINIAIQGEICGPGIQGEKMNNDKLTETKFFVFRIWDITHQRYYTSAERLQFLRKLWNDYHVDLLHVPVLFESNTLQELGINSMPDLLKFAEGPSLNPEVEREGIVFKSNDTGFHFKVISNKYLLGESGKKESKKERKQRQAENARTSKDSATNLMVNNND